MKKTFICIIALLMLVMPMQNGLAASEFSLVNGDLAEKSTEYALLQEFLQSIQISSSFDAGQNKYSLSGNANVTGSYEYVSNNATGTDSCTGENLRRI